MCYSHIISFFFPDWQDLQTLNKGWRNLAGAVLKKEPRFSFKSKRYSYKTGYFDTSTCTHIIIIIVHMYKGWDDMGCCPLSISEAPPVSYMQRSVCVLYGDVYKAMK